MKLKKRKKAGRFAGTQTHKRGAKERTRSRGNKGGQGMSGTGKRGDQKKTLVIKLTGGNNYFGKSKTLRRGQARVKTPSISLATIQSSIAKLVKRGKAKASKDSYEITLDKYKILSSEHFTLKAKIHALSASKAAQDAVKAAKGEIILKVVESKEKPKEVKEKPAESKEKPKKAKPKKSK